MSKEPHAFELQMTQDRRERFDKAVDGVMHAFQEAKLHKIEGLVVLRMILQLIEREEGIALSEVVAVRQPLAAQKPGNA